MNKLRNIGLTGGVFGLVLGVPALFSSALSAPVNPCPKIYYEEPYNSRLIVPQNCPPNAITRSVSGNPGALQRGASAIGSDLPGRTLTPNRVPGTSEQQPSIFNEAPYNRNPPGTPVTLPIKPPLPENRSQAIASVTPTNGRVDMKLKNNMNVAVTYEAVGYTPRRTLAPGAEATLRNLPVPVTLTLVRQDNGFVEVLPMKSSESGLLSLTLDEDATPLDRNQGVIRVQQDGQVFLN